MVEFKEQLIQTLNNVNEVIEGGDYSPFKAKLELDSLVKELGLIQNEVNQIALEEAQKYGEKSFEVDGVKVEKRAGATRYDYKGCKAWTIKKEELTEVEKILKHSYQLYLKGHQIANEDGEELMIPKVTHGKDIIIVK